MATRLAKRMRTDVWTIRRYFAIFLDALLRGSTLAAWKRLSRKVNKQFKILFEFDEFQYTRWGLKYSAQHLSVLTMRRAETAHTTHTALTLTTVYTTLGDDKFILLEIEGGYEKNGVISLKAFSHLLQRIQYILLKYYTPRAHFVTKWYEKKLSFQSNQQHNSKNI